MSYQTVATRLESSYTIKQSRFIVMVSKATTVAQAMAWLESCRATHPDANHHCWAYRIAEHYRFSDDGEPGGTAGRPMLELLEKRQLDRIMAVVVRYFGGVKLGTGGLVRAYAGSLAKALDGARIVQIEARSALRVHVPYPLSDVVFRFLDEAEGMQLEKLEPEYDSLGVIVRFSLLQRAVDACLQQLRELSQGQAQLQAREDLPLA